MLDLDSNGHKPIAEDAKRQIFWGYSKSERHSLVLRPHPAFGFFRCSWPSAPTHNQTLSTTLSILTSFT